MKSTVALILLSLALPLAAQPRLAGPDIPNGAEARAQPLSEKDATIGDLFDTLVPATSLISAMLAAYERKYKTEWDQEGGADLEAKYPGLLAATMKVGTDTYATAIARNFPLLKSEYIKLASSQLTPAEVSEFGQLLKSPSGHRLMSSVLAALAAGLPAAEARTRVASDLLASATPSEMESLKAFSEGAAIKKLIDIRAEFRPRIAAWGSAVNAEANPLILKNIEAASASYVENAVRDTKK